MTTRQIINERQHAAWLALYRKARREAEVEEAFRLIYDRPLSPHGPARAPFIPSPPVSAVLVETDFVGHTTAEWIGAELEYGERSAYHWKPSPPDFDVYREPCSVCGDLVIGQHHCPTGYDLDGLDAALNRELDLRA